MGIERAAAFLMAREDSGGIGKLFLSGGGARIPGMAEVLGRRVNVETEPANPFERLSMRPDAATGIPINESAPLLLLPVGLALRG